MGGEGLEKGRGQITTVDLGWGERGGSRGWGGREEQGLGLGGSRSWGWGGAGVGGVRGKAVEHIQHVYCFRVWVVGAHRSEVVNAHIGCTHL